MRWPWQKPKPKPVRVVVMNGLEIELVVLELVPGKVERVTLVGTYNLCDRGFNSPDGEHRLEQKDLDTVVKIKLEGTP